MVELVSVDTNNFIRRTSFTTARPPSELNTAEAVQIKLIVAIIPAYNEEKYIGSVVLKALQYVHHVIVVDDGSADQTAEVAGLAGAIVVRHMVNRGKGVALNTGFSKAQELFLPNVVVTMDGDWQHMPEELPLVMGPILNDTADLVIGSRYLEKTSHVPIQRVLGHWGFTSLVNALSGTPLTDSQSGFRAFSLPAITALIFSSKGFSVESEMQFLARDYRFRVTEVPITIRYEDKPKRSVIVHGLKVLNGVLALIGQHRPFLFFAIPGFLLLSLGALIGLWVIHTYTVNQELAIGTALLAILFCMIGCLSLFTAIILHSLRGFVLNFLHGNEGAAWKP